VPEPKAPARPIRLNRPAEPKVAVQSSAAFAVPDQPEFEQVTRGIDDIKDMVPISV
jgi:hypothetical protein